ncbi:sigma-70 family RNA polymerase sigma factor, partial [Candidatus Poribacteria bacterium]|nr:sigma-70 family RNA polymerase sigma factor [Candidatus Poribacteria bacterium]
MKHNDVDLIRRIREGDDSAFTHLVEEYQKQVHALAWKIIGDFHIAEEIAQDTFLKVYQKLDTLKNPQQFAGWLYVITSRLCYRWIRKNRKQAELLDDAEIGMLEETAYSKYVADENTKVRIEAQRKVVHKLLSKLQESERTVMVLHYFSEMTCEEISRFLGVSTSAIKSRLSRARQRLKKEEPMIREALSNFQITPNLTENIIRQIEHLNPAAPSAGNPILPWALAASSFIIVVLILGMGSRKLARYQQPYSLNLEAAMAVELIDTQIVRDIDEKPEVRTLQGNRSDKTGTDNNTGQESNQAFNDQVDYTQWGLPDGAKARIGKGWLTGNMAFSPDGRRLAVAGIIGTWIYDARPGKVKELDLLAGHTDRVRYVSFSPDGNRIASASNDMTVRLYEVATGEHIATFEGHTGPVGRLAFSPDGDTVATGSSDHTVMLWDAYTGKHKKTLKGHSDWVSYVAYSSDGKTIATGSGDKTTRLWDAHTGEHKTTLKGHSETVDIIALSPDGKTIATGSENKTVWLWDIQTGNHIITLKGHTGAVKTVLYSSDGETIATGSSDNSTRLWDAKTGKQLHKAILGDQKASIFSIAFSPDGKTIATRNDFNVRLWDVHTGQQRDVITGHIRSGLEGITFSPDGKTIAFGDNELKAQVWDVNTTQPKMVLSGHTGHVRSVAFSPDGKTIATSSYDKTARIWDVNTGNMINTLTGHTKYVNAIAYSPDGKTLATGSDDKTVR